MDFEVDTSESKFQIYLLSSVSSWVNCFKVHEPWFFIYNIGTITSIDCIEVGFR